MKKLLITLLMFVLTIGVNAQYLKTEKQSRIPESVKVIILYTGAIVLDAVGDGLCDDGNKAWGHALNAASVGILVASPFILDIQKDKWYWYLLSYVSLRVALFDPVYNLTRGLPIDYIGDNSIWDKGMQEFNPPRNAQLWGRSVFLVVGLTIPLREIGR